MADVIDIGFRVRVEQVAAALKTMPGITDAEVKKMVANLDKGWAKAEKDAAKSAKATEAAWKNNLNKVSSAAANLGSQLGGPFAKLGSLGQGALKPLAEVGESLGEVGGAVTGVGLAVAAGAAAAALFAAGILKVASAADEAGKDLQTFGLGVSKGAQADLDAYTDGTQALRIEFDKLTVTLGSGVAASVGQAKGALAEFTSGVNAAAEAAPDFNVALGGSVLVAGALLGPLGAVAIALSEIVIFAKGKEVTDRMEAIRKEGEEMAKVYTDIAAASKESTDQMLANLAKVENEDKAAADIRRDHQKAVEEWALADMLATAKGVVAQDEYKQKLHDTAVEQQRSFDAANRGWDDLVTHTKQSVSEAEAASRHALEALAQTAAGEREQIAGMVDELVGKLGGLADQASAASLEAGQAAMDAAGQAASAWADSAKANLDAQKKAGQLTDDQYDQQLAQIDATAEAKSHANDKIAKADLKAAVQAFHLSQASQIASATMGAFLAEIQAFAQLGPVAGAIAAPLIGATLGADIVAIEGQSPPSYPMGGMVDADHHLVGVQSGEAVLSRRAVLELGEETIGRLNRGQGAQGPSSVVVQLDRRTLAEAVTRSGVARPRQRLGRRRTRRH